MPTKRDPTSPPVAAAPQRRHPPDVRRRMIVHTARSVIAEHGLLNVQVRDVARACNVSPGTVSYHFESLNELLWEVVKTETKEFYAPLSDAAPRCRSAWDGISLLLSGMFGTDENTRIHWLIWLDFWGVAARRDVYGDWMKAHYAAWHQTLADLARRGIAAHDFAVADPDLAAFEIATLVDGIAVQCFSRTPRLTVEDARRATLAFAGRRLQRHADARQPS